MSLQAMVWAFSQDLKPTAKLTLLALADHCDEQGRCWPSVARLSQRTGLKERALRNTIGELAEAGVLEIIERRDTDGRQLSNAYRLLPKAATPPALDAPPGMHEVQGTVHDVHPLEEISPKKKIPPKNQSKNHPEEPQSARGRARAVDDLEGFDLPFVSETFSEAFRSWLRHRHQKRNRLDPGSETWRQQRKLLVKWGEADSIVAIEHSVANGWHALVLNSDNRRNGKTKGSAGWAGGPQKWSAEELRMMGETANEEKPVAH